jgi:hypothetical protein
VRLSEQLASVMAELRQATEASRQRQELNSQVSEETEPKPFSYLSVFFKLQGSCSKWHAQVHHVTRPCHNVRHGSNLPVIVCSKLPSALAGSLCSLCSQCC